MTWEEDWADRIEEEYARQGYGLNARSRTLSTSVAELETLVVKLQQTARSAPALRAAIKDAVDHGLVLRSDSNGVIYRSAMERLRQLEELEACGHPTTAAELIKVCSSLPIAAEPSSEGWRAAPAQAVLRFGHRQLSRKKGESCWRAAFESSLEAVPHSLTGQMSAAGMTHTLRALSRFRATSSQDIRQLVRLVRGSSTNGLPQCGALRRRSHATSWVAWRPLKAPRPLR